MDRRTRTIAVVGVALISATLASVGVYRAVKRIPVREIEVAHQFVVLSARPLPLGARLEASDLKRVGWPSSSPLPGAYSRVEDVVGRGLVTAVGENEPITDAKIAPREAGAGLSPAIPRGMRAISVKVNEVIGVAGFAVPGARVDVLATVRRPGDALTRVLVANVPVLTAGTRYEQEQGRDTKPIPSTVVTLVVTPNEAEKIALASAEGQITLMLRNPVDVEAPATPGARLARLVGDAETDAPQPARTPPVTSARAVGSTGQSRVALPAPVVNQAPPPRTYTVEAIRAGKRTLETIP
jgi:pilus assembly protein CpaB